MRIVPRQYVAMGNGQSKHKLAKPQAIELIETINNKRFFKIDEDELLRQVQAAFSSELDRLKGAFVAERAGTQTQPQKSSPSMRLYGKEYGEVNRTLTGLLCLRWIYNNEYTQFTRNQNQARRLGQSSFEWLHDHFQRHLRSTDDVRLLVVSLIINDLGKDEHLEIEVNKCYQEQGQDLREQNHDFILYEAARMGMIPCLQYLNDHQTEDLKIGLALGAELNAGQLAQAESVPINLEFLQEMKGQQHAFEMKFMEQMLDISGAQGHVNSDGAMSMIQPVFEAFQTVHYVSLKVINEGMELRKAYDLVLKKRNNLLIGVGFRRLSVNNDRDRALLRLLTMGRTVDKDQAELFSEAFDQLDSEDQHALIKGLNIDGDVNERAVLPYYMPAVIAETLSKTKSRSNEHRRQAVTSIMRYLAKVFKQSPSAVLLTNSPSSSPTGGAQPSVPGVVIEHNMKKVLEFVNTDRFAENPDTLDELDIPPAQPLQRRRTSHSLASGESEFLPKSVSRSGTTLSAPPAPIREGNVFTGFTSPFGKG
jgi:hypothetical protein